MGKLPNVGCEIFGGCEYRARCEKEGCVYNQPADLEKAYTELTLRMLSRPPINIIEGLRYRSRRSLQPLIKEE